MEGIVMEGNMRLEIGSNMGVCGRPAIQSHDVNQLLDNDNQWDSGSEDHATQALKIQRAWRQYKEKNNSEQNANRMSTSVDSLETGKEGCPPASPSEAELSEAESGHQAMSVSSPEECPRYIHDTDERQFDFMPERQTLLPQFVSRVQEIDASDDDEPDDEDEDDEDEEEDSESDSTPSDGYKTSAMPSDPTQGVALKPLSFYKEHDKQNENVVFSSPGEDADDQEINEQIAKRARKNNYLTLAQEFATFKKSHPDALPFNVHKIRQQQQLEARESSEIFAKMSPSKINHIPQSDDSHSLIDSPTDDRFGCFPTRKKKSRDVGVNCSDLPKTDVPDILKLDGLDIRGRYPSPPKFEDNDETSHSPNAVNCSSAIQGRRHVSEYNPANSGRQDYAEHVTSGFSKGNDKPYYLVPTPVPKPEKATIQSNIDDTFMSRNTDISPTQVAQCPPANMTSACDVKKIPRNTVSYGSANGSAYNAVSDCSTRPPANMPMSGPRRECDRSSNNRSKNNTHSFHCPVPAASAKGHGHGNGYHSKFSSNKEFYNTHRRDLKLSSPEILGGFDVYNIETAMPTIDWDAMEEHLAKSAKEELLWRRRNDREEIRRRLATGSDTEDYYGGERMMRKPSLQTRLQSGMNLQICFMNETAKDTEHSPEGKETEKDARPVKGNERASPPMAGHNKPNVAPSSLPLSPKPIDVAREEVDFVTQQARLQAEARMALAQAKEMAHMQMEVEKQRKKKSPIAEMVHGIPICRYIVGIAFPDGRRRTSRHVLNEMNVAQLQVIVNDLHTQIETLNEELVRLLLERDDLHMEQDSMLVDIEDLTRYLGAKDQAQKEQVKPGSSSSSAQQGRGQPTKSQTAILKLRLKK